MIFSGIAVSVPMVIVLLIRFTPKPPVGDMEYAREVISRAEKNKADTYSKKLFVESKMYYDSALFYWQNENKRFIFSRNYEKVARFAELSARKANMAGENSISSASILEAKLKQKFISLNKLILKIDHLFTTYPLTPELRSRISKGKILLKEAEISYSKGLYQQSDRKFTDSEYLLTASYQDATNDLKNYFNSYSNWKKMVNNAVTDSKRNHDYSIIIEKFSRKFLVYHNGIRKYEFSAELGRNWVGVKRTRGDKATPEGLYRITKKFEGSKTKYYKALLLNYPNDEDKARFKDEIARGSLPPDATIGGLIEIHGSGGKGIDWTEGCVALTDKEMDLIFKIAKVGTPVTIVGSLVDLQYIVNR